MSTVSRRLFTAGTRRRGPPSLQFQALRAEMLRSARGHTFNRKQRSAIKRIAKSGKEKNYFDTVSSSSAVSTTATVTKLTGIGQGDGQGQRLGDVVEMTSVEFNYSLATDAGASAGTLNTGRILIIKWLVDDTDTSPLIGDILENGASTSFGPFVGDQADRKKFQVIYDNHHLLTVRDGPRCAVVVDKNRISCKGQKIYFDNAATTGKGHYYLVTCGNNPVGANDMNLNYYFRMRYIEP